MVEEAALLWSNRISTCDADRLGYAVKLRKKILDLQGPRRLPSPRQASFAVLEFLLQFVARTRQSAAHSSRGTSDDFGGFFIFQPECTNQTQYLTVIGRKPPTRAGR